MQIHNVHFQTGQITFKKLSYIANLFSCIMTEHAYAYLLSKGICCCCFKRTLGGMYKYNYFFSMLTNHQIRYHQATHTVGCQVGDYRSSLNLPQGFVWVYIGLHTHFITPRVFFTTTRNLCKWVRFSCLRVVQATLLYRCSDCQIFPSQCYPTVKQLDQHSRSTAWRSKTDKWVFQFNSNSLWWVNGNPFDAIL